MLKFRPKPPPHNYAGAAYFGTLVQPAGGDSFSVNIGNYVEPGIGRDATTQDAMCASTSHFGLEIDQGNNSRISYGDEPFDFSIPHGRGGEMAPLKIIGHSATASRGTAAILAYGLDGQVWNRGIAFDGDSIVTATLPGQHERRDRPACRQRSHPRRGPQPSDKHAGRFANPQQ